MQHSMHVPVEVAGSVPLTQEVLQEGVKPFLLTIKCIDVVHPVDKKHVAANPTMSQGTEHSSKKFAQGT